MDTTAGLLHLIMEEYDAISAGPDKNGCINISMCAWQSLPYEDVFLFKSKLIKLDVSHNQLQDLPKGFGCLEMLADLNLSHNKLTSLDNLEQLKRLRILDASHNQIVDLPSNVGECHMLVSKKARCWKLFLKLLETLTRLLLYQFFLVDTFIKSKQDCFSCQ